MHSDSVKAKVSIADSVGCLLKSGLSSFPLSWCDFAQLSVSLHHSPSCVIQGMGCIDKFCLNQSQECPRNSHGIQFCPMAGGKSAEGIWGKTILLPRKKSKRRQILLPVDVVVLQSGSHLALRQGQNWPRGWARRRASGRPGKQPWHIPSGAHLPLEFLLWEITNVLIV